MYAAAGPGPSPSSVEPESEWSSKGETARQATADQWGAAESEGVNALTPPPRLTYVITQGASSSALDLTGMAGLAAVQHHLASFHRGGVATPQLSSGGSDDGGSPPSPGTTTTTPPPSPSPGGVGAGKDRSSPLLETPTRKNKRKLSEPRKRGGGGGGGTDFSIKRLCTDSPGGSAMSESGCSDDGGEADSHRGRRVRRRLSHDDSASSRGLSEREDTPVPGGSSSGGGGGGGGGLTLGAGGQAPHHPFFPSGLPPTTCFMPGFYLHAADGRAGGFPPPPFPGLPLALPHPGLQAVAAAAAAAAADHQRGDGGLGDLSSGRSASGLGHHHGHHHHHPGLHAQDLSRDDSPDNLSGDDSTNGGGSGGGGRKPRKNYKNMTRERRVEANARERTRVHTISAAFDALRRAVPSYSYNQKLSKLAILRIACTYIMALARLADVDCSSEPSVPVTFADCVDLCTRTIQTEGRARRRH